MLNSLLKKMIKVGLTGGIGSGKSIIIKIFSSIGIPVYIADEKAKILMNSNFILQKSLIKEFGDEVYANNKLNAKYLSEIIFNNKNALNKINSIVHPFVMSDFVQWAQNQQHANYVLMESAILFETGLYKEFDKIISVTAPENLRIKRIINRDKLSKDEIKRRIENQYNDEERLALSDYVIKNDEDELVIPQILKIHNEIIKTIN